MKVEEIKRYYHSYYQYTPGDLTVYEVVGTLPDSDSDVGTFNFLYLEDAKKSCVQNYKSLKRVKLDKFDHLFTDKSIRLIVFLSFFGLFKYSKKHYDWFVQEKDKIIDEISNAEKRLKVKFLPKEMDVPVPLEFGTTFYFLSVNKKIKIQKTVIVGMSIWHNPLAKQPQKPNFDVRYKLKSVDKDGKFIQKNGLFHLLHNDIDFENKTAKTNLVNHYVFFNKKDALEKAMKILKNMEQDLLGEEI